ncbi:polysaccharide deacetylase family protein [Ruegeria sp. HKCCA6837]|uniref:polysaccharide deacetylase family protein n=1 Tax=Ruegeria sp. HKCCA6837 TaxID=2682989 RepID=UPI0014886E87|nr:polysaccharide deacetylase family protein [Ruegeria sp. HKCCA6837]
MTPDWHPLDTELDLWRVSGLSFPLWWRDDDAIAPTPQLDRLADLSSQLDVPLHLAVIPNGATPALAEYIADRPSLIPVVHGWAHVNHAPEGEKKAEFQLHRPLDQMVDDAKAGMARLGDLFGDDMRPMFVPPWNRIAPEIAAQLPDLGFRILSTATPRKTPFPAPGLEQINTHLDPIDWRGTRSLINPDILIKQTVDLLRDRREGRADNAEPFGILTHHLVHDQDIWTFTEALLRKLLNGPATVWVAPRNE